ncbi:MULTISPECIES: folate-binding protein [unclassified Moorena]|uniref:CAF17-like 4Fe-4S cluster assembly/insertion protein YgfZ n=1 Tax=unclassified Moorena TaxID=2683338 RepID=UPI0013FF8D32|nr:MULTISPECIES: folate-binding protein [unclassified Moorena]NEO14619.1 folate-binding protein YgfZ [Moorena sp. SIO3E8]NEQ02807.1 folate-binding protein YgfZ [Moorena sp. SIO3F7]
MTNDQLPIKTQKLLDVQRLAGAKFESVASGMIPVSFGNDAAGIEAARQGVALVDFCHWGLIKVSGDDRLRYLHNQSTNDFQTRQPGQGCQTVFVTSTARTIDLATAYILADAVLLLVSPNCRQQIMEWLDRYIFPMDRVELQDVSDHHAVFSLIGPVSDALLTGLSVEISGEDASHQQLMLGDNQVRIAVGSGLALPGYTLICPAENAAQVWQTLTTAGAIPIGDRVWEQLRIQQGRPAPGHELTEDYNPLEAGLWQTISFSKGCYIGQETIARLNTYKGVKQRLWGIRLSAPTDLGSVITVDGEKVGKLTSLTETDQGVFGLAYIRTKAGGVGLKVLLGDVEGEIMAVPGLSHDYYEPSAE